MTTLPFGRGSTQLQNLIARSYRGTVISAFTMTGALDAGQGSTSRKLPSLEGSAQEICHRIARAANILAGTGRAVKGIAHDSAP